MRIISAFIAEFGIVESPTSTKGSVPSTGAQKETKTSYSPYADLNYPTRVFWGEAHLHTSHSPDAGMVGDHLGPDEAIRFARGEQIQSSTGQPTRLERPYDWLMISDHAEYFGLAQALAEANPDLMNTQQGKEWAAAFKEGGQAAYEAFVGMTRQLAEAKPGLPADAREKLARTYWDRAIAAIEKNNDPGKFTTFHGFEWTQSVDGNNLHRNVVFRDGADKVGQILPYSEFDSASPVDLWRWLEAYENKTGGRAFTIAHNPNLSCGLMFGPKTETGQAIGADYAELRSRFDRLVEVTQSKGDSETTPELSPDDQFADFERWNKANIFGMVATTSEMLPYNYVRSALKLGIAHEAAIGVDPFKVGLAGGSDNHSSMCSTRAENYFGVAAMDEPSPDRWSTLFMKSQISPQLDVHMWEMLPGGITGVWATENTREAIWDALYRREVYATSGTRPVLRFFGGWNFDALEIENPEWMWVKRGYEDGVPMGGELRSAPKGSAPTFMLHALSDPSGALLDRIQIIKGWIDSAGKTHERVIDVSWSGDREPDAKTGIVPSVGNTVDVKNATWTNTIGEPMLHAVWRDPDFDPSVRSFYYMRVIEIPTPRWTSYDAKRFNVAINSDVPMIVINRAYSSPIWYSP